jgi:hypothetical protein
MDLRAEPVVLQVPAVPDRYELVQAIKRGRVESAR